MAFTSLRRWPLAWRQSGTIGPIFATGLPRGCHGGATGVPGGCHGGLMARPGGRSGGAAQWGLPVGPPGLGKDFFSGPPQRGNFLSPRRNTGRRLLSPGTPPCHHGKFPFWPAVTRTITPATRNVPEIPHATYQPPRVQRIDNRVIRHRTRVRRPAHGNPHRLGHV